MFDEAHQDPIEHPLLTDKIQKLRVKNYRNMIVEKEKLKPYLTEDATKFQFKGVNLRADSEKSISGIITNENDDDEYEPNPKQARSSKQRKTAAKTVPKKSNKSSNACLSEFLKGHEIMKQMKMPPFDPFLGNAEEWISSFEKEFREYGSVNDIGFSNMLHLLKTDEGKK